MKKNSNTQLTTLNTNNKISNIDKSHTYSIDHTHTHLPCLKKKLRKMLRVFFTNFEIRITTNIKKQLANNNQQTQTKTGKEGKGTKNYIRINCNASKTSLQYNKRVNFKNKTETAGGQSTHTLLLNATTIINKQESFLAKVNTKQESKGNKLLTHWKYIYIQDRSTIKYKQNTVLLNNNDYQNKTTKKGKPTAALTLCSN